MSVLEPSESRTSPQSPSTFDDWLAALEARHMADLTFAEVGRALRALSSTYVERRQQIGEGAALSGAGKRAAFALFYGPLHYLLVREIAARVRTRPTPPRLVDLGCGTGAASAAWASVVGESPADRCAVLGVDRHPWALQEAAWTYRFFNLAARTVRSDATAARLPREPAVVLAAFVLNELAAETRAALIARLVERNRSGSPVLIVEPLARSAAPWWARLQRDLARDGARADEWRFTVPLPPLVARLDRAAGLDHRELTGRSIWLP